MATIHGFRMLREQSIAELGGTGRLYEHAQSGARLLSVSNSDENKVFGISFRTPPADSSGIAHILAHSVLCGSAKYPVKAATSTTWRMSIWMRCFIPGSMRTSSARRVGTTN